MIVRVLLFAAAREKVGQESIEVSLPSESTVAQLKQTIGELFPALRELLRTALLAVDHEYAGNDLPLNSASEIALIPPVSGG